MKKLPLFLLFSLSILSGCAGVQLPVQKQARPDGRMGYIGGDFHNHSETFISGFLLKNLENSEEVVISFFTKPGSSTIGREVGMLQVKPGRYRITDWVAYNVFWGTRGGFDMKRPVTEGPLGEPFEVRPGEIIFLGKFDGATSWKPENLRWTTRSAIRVVPFSAKNASSVVRAEYPAFGEMSIRCITCDQ